MALFRQIQSGLGAYVPALRQQCTESARLLATHLEDPSRRARRSAGSDPARRRERPHRPDRHRLGGEPSASTSFVVSRGQPLNRFVLVVEHPHLHSLGLQAEGEHPAQAVAMRLLAGDDVSTTSSWSRNSHLTGMLKRTASGGRGAPWRFVFTCPTPSRIRFAGPAWGRDRRQGRDCQRASAGEREASADQLTGCHHTSEPVASPCSTKTGRSVMASTSAIRHQRTSPRCFSKMYWASSIDS